MTSYDRHKESRILHLRYMGLISMDTARELIWEMLGLDPSREWARLHAEHAAEKELEPHPIEEAIHE